MSIGTLCIREVHLADCHDSVQHAARRMEQHNVGTLVVLDQAQRPVGIVTDRDLALRVVGAGRSTRNTHVEDIMTRSPVSVTEDTSLEEALALMRSGPYRRLLVIDQGGKLVGLIAVDDILELLAQELKQVGELLENETAGPFSASDA